MLSLSRASLPTALWAEVPRAVAAAAADDDDDDDADVVMLECQLAVLSSIIHAIDIDLTI